MLLWPTGLLSFEQRPRRSAWLMDRVVVRVLVGHCQGSDRQPQVSDGEVISHRTPVPRVVGRALAHDPE